LQGQFKAQVRIDANRWVQIDVYKDNSDTCRDTSFIYKKVMELVTIYQGLELLI